MKALAVIFCLVSSFAFSQTKGYQQQSNQYAQPKKSAVVIYIPWTSEMKGYWGSFWWKVTKQRIDGIYYYKVYVFSNSHFNVRDYYGNYKKAITKLSDCVIWAKDYDGAVEFDVGTVVFDWESTYLYQFYTDDPIPRIQMKYSVVSPYDYSKKI